MASSADDTIETAALGRPFQLGMLYDCRKDTLIPGMTLWDQQQIQNNKSVQQQNKTEYEVTTSDKIEDNSNFLKISGSLKLSVLGGLVDVGGSAKYFQDTKKSNKQARVTLQYKTSTTFETLTKSHLARGQVSHPEDDTATHVVMGILYGAVAYFVFDRESSLEDKKEQMEGEAKLTFNKLKKLTADAEASFNMDEKEKSAVEKFSCTFHGDFELDTNPTSFRDVVRVYRDLPNMLGENGEHAVPLRVWLYPLCKLDSRAARLVRDISTNMIRYSSDTIESFTKTEMRCRDILRDKAAAAFPALVKKVEDFMQMCHQYKLDLIQNVGSVLPSIRGGGKEESALEDILNARDSSPFNSKDLDQWLTNKEKELDTLKSYLKQLEKLGANMNDNLEDLLSDLDLENIVSFSFTSVDGPDSLLVKLSDYFKPSGMLDTSAEFSHQQATNKEWLSNDVRQIMRKELKLFGELKKMSTSDDTKFIVASKYDESHPGACIFIYEDGSADGTRFVPPSKPATPTTTDVSHDSVTVHVSDPDSATVEYRVEYREKKNQQIEWKSHPVQRNQEAVTLSGLKQGTEYEIRATAVGKLGYAVSSDICRAVTLAVPSKPASPTTTDVSYDSVTIKLSDPDSATVEYRVEYREKQNQETEWKSHPVQRNQEAVTLSGLKPKTEYEIRATAVGKLDYAVSSEVCSAVTLAVPSKPATPTTTDVSHDSVTVHVSDPDSATVEYRVEYREKNNQQIEWKSHPVQRNQEAVTLSGLKPKTEYEIRATAVGKLDYAVSSEVCSAVTLAVPSKPATPTTTDVSHDSVTVHVSDPDSATVEYRVEYRKKKNQETEWKSHPVQRNQEAVTLSGLKQGTEYEIRATAVGKLGYAVSSDICRAVTLAVPSKPASPTPTDISYDRITVKVSDPDSATVEYRVEYREKRHQDTEWKSHPVQRNQEAVTLSGLKPKTEYEIRATAVGKLDYAVSSEVCSAVTLAVPSKPATPTTTDVSHDSVTVHVSDPDSATVEYRVEYREKNNQQIEWKSHPVQRNQEAVTLSGLKPKTEYEIRATAVGKLDYAVSSEVCSAVTLAVPSKPATPTTTDVSHDSVTVHVSDPDSATVEYRVEYREKNNQETEWKSHPVQRNQEAVTLSGLKQGTEYEIRATAVDKLGYAVSSDICRAVTLAVPSKPASPTPTDISYDRITVKVSDPDSATVEYRVEYREKRHQDTEWKSHPVQRNQEAVTLSGLKPKTEYEIRATAVGKLDYAVSSEVCSAVTLAVPSKPATPTTTGISHDSVTVQVSDPDSATVEYQVEYREKQNQETEWKSHPVQRNQQAVTLSGLKPKTEYEIRATVVGEHGYAVSSDVCSSVTLAELSKPATPTITGVSYDSITVKVSDPDSATVEYRVEYREKQNQETEWKSRPVQRSQEAATLSGLKSKTEYEIRATAVGEHGYAVSSNVCSAVTLAVPSKPATPNTTCVSHDSVTVKVSDPDSATVEYRVEYREKQNQETEWKSRPVQRSQEAVTLSGLNPKTEYEIRATAVGEHGYAVSSDVCSSVTLAVPSKPATPNTTDVSHDSVTVKVSGPDSATVEYRVEYREKQNQEPEWKSHPVQRNEEAATLSGLKPKTEYEIRAIAVGKHGYAVSSEVCRAVTLTVVGPPTELRVVTVKATYVILTWSPPSDQHCESVKQYIIEFRDESSSQWHREDTGKEYSYTLNNLKENTPYSIRMYTDDGVRLSQPGKELQIQTKKVPMDNTKFTLLSGDPPVYLLNLTECVNLNKKVFGSAPATKASNKTIMVVGATGSGKTTLINGMINYILGVEWEDNCRFKLIDEQTSKSQTCSQTSEVTAYQIYPSDEFQVKYSLTIIDTPGFGDTRGIKQDQEITDKIRQFFSVKGGIDSIDAVCFVVQSALARLTHTQKYIFDAILSIFGKNIASNIITLVTFADGKTPPVLEAIKAADIPCATGQDDSPLHFKFNNSVLFAKNTGANNDDNEFDRMFWKLGKTSMIKFFSHLSRMNPQSLTLTKEVLKERRHLEATVEGLQPMIQKGLATLREIETTRGALQNHETHMKQNKDFEYEVDIPTFEQINIDRGTFITNCHGCNYTCHYPCHIPKDADKSGCAAMSKDNCTVCPGKCHWSKHVNMTYRYETKVVKEKRTYQELKSKYETALGQKMSTENIMKQLEEDYVQVQKETLEIMDTVTQCLDRLSEIALRPDPLATPDYIDLLIESEKREGKRGFKERIKELETVRKKAVIVQNARQGMEKLTLEEQTTWQKLQSKIKKGIHSIFS